MTKQEAIDFMISEIEKIERQRIAENMSIDPREKKADAVGKIKKILESVDITDED